MRIPKFSGGFIFPLPVHVFVAGRSYAYGVSGDEGGRQPAARAYPQPGHQMGPAAGGGVGEWLAGRRRTAGRVQ